MRKIFGIFIVMLLIGTAFITVGKVKEKSNFTIIRDNYGVPHIYADTKEDIAFGMGYAIAEDRLWQLDLIRRQTTGRLAEFDLASLDDDLFVRTIGTSTDDLLKIYNNISSPYKEIFTAFVDGVNHYINEAIADPNNKLPAEYIERDILPEYLSVEDSLAIGIMSLKLWGEAGTGNELFNLIDLFSLIQQNGISDGWNIFNDLYPITDPGAVTTIDGDSNENSINISKNPPFYHPFILKIAQKIIEKEESFNQISKSLGLLNHFGSNGWVVSPQKSESGNSLLLGGPQMGYSIPQQVVEIGLHGADIDVVGVTIPGGGPIIIIGVGQWCAWTQTTGYSDLVDTYIERLNPFNKMKYKFNHRWLEMDKRIETIYDSSGVAHEYELLNSIHGTVLGSFWIPIFGGFAITRKEPDWSKTDGLITAFLNLPDCKNVSEFGTQLKEIPTSHNFLCADRYGNIGYYHTGWYPIRPDKGFFRRAIDQRLPLWGTGKEEWKGILSFEENPQGINPSKGFYANWNNKPSPDWSYSEGHSFWQECGWGENVRRIQELLEDDDSISIEDMKEICKTVAYHEFWGTNFEPYLIEAINNVGGISSEVLMALENWDCYYNDVDSDGFYNDPGFTIFDEWFFNLYDEVFVDEIPTSISYWKAISLLLHVLQGEDSPLELKYTNYLNGVSRDELIIDTLQDSLQSLEIRYGTNNVSRWLYPAFKLTGSNPMFDEVGNLKSPEKLGYIIPFMNRGTYNQIAEMPNWYWSNESDFPIGVNVLPSGQSGFVQYPDIPSPHAYDQMDLYLNWEFKPMLFNLST